MNVEAELNQRLETLAIGVGVSSQEIHELRVIVLESQTAVFRHRDIGKGKEGEAAVGDDAWEDVS